MTNPLPKKKYKLFTIVFVVCRLASVSAIFLGYYLDQKQKSETAFAAKQQLTAVAELINVLLLGKNKNVRLALRDNDIDYAGLKNKALFSESPEGAGVGPAIVQRIIYRRLSPLWSEGKLQGATFYFSLPVRG